MTGIRLFDVCYTLPPPSSPSLHLRSSTTTDHGHCSRWMPWKLVSFVLTVIGPCPGATYLCAPGGGEAPAHDRCCRRGRLGPLRCDATIERSSGVYSRGLYEDPGKGREIPLISDHQVSRMQVFVYGLLVGFQTTRTRWVGSRQGIHSHAEASLLINCLQILPPPPWPPYNVMPEAHRRHPVQSILLATRKVLLRHSYLPIHLLTCTVHITYYAVVAVCRAPPQLGQGGDSMLIIEAPHWYMTTASAGCG